MILENVSLIRKVLPVPERPNMRICPLLGSLIICCFSSSLWVSIYALTSCRLYRALKSANDLIGLKLIIARSFWSLLNSLSKGPRLIKYKAKIKVMTRMMKMSRLIVPISPNVNWMFKPASGLYSPFKNSPINDALMRGINSVNNKIFGVPCLFFQINLPKSINVSKMYLNLINFLHY